MRRLPLALTALMLLAPATAGAKPRDLLPDLAQGGPTGVDVVIDVSTGTPQTRLVFDSTIGNVGEGPLILTARRKPGATTMTAHQVIRRSDGSTRVLRTAAGVLKYVQAADHQHWHLMGIDRYELWTGNASRRLRRDRKQGFCLGDRYQLTPGRRMPHQPRKPAFPGYCGKRAAGPDERSLRASRSAGATTTRPTSRASTSTSTGSRPADICSCTASDPAGCSRATRTTTSLASRSS